MSNSDAKKQRKKERRNIAAIEVKQDVPAQDPESVEKDMSGMNCAPMPAPTTWEEMDAIDQAQEQAHELRELTWDVQNLVYNIVTCPDMKPADVAGAIADAGKGFGKRMNDIISGKSVEKSKDIDLLSAEVMIARDKRENNIFARTFESITKGVLTSEQENALPDSAFALVKDVNGVKVRKYPVHDKVHVRNALSRAAQQISAGGPGAADAKEALPGIKAAAKKLGVGVADMKKEKSAIIVEKDASGKWRWVGWYTNKFIDSDEDIFAEVAHKEYESWLDANPQFFPMFLSWHTPGTVRKSATDFVHYENGFMMVSGPLEDSEAAGLMTVMKEQDLGMSHQSFVFRDENDPRVIVKYRTFEVSDLPVKNASNPFTLIPGLITKEVTVDKKQYLATIFGDAEKAEAFIKAAGVLEKGITDAGIESKDKDETTTPATPAPAAPDMTQAISAVLKKEFGIDDLAAFVKKSQEAFEKIPTLETALKVAAKDQDERLAAMISPRAGAGAIQAARATSKESSAVPEGDPLASAAPGIPDDAWLSKATNTMPLKEA